MALKFNNTQTVRDFATTNTVSKFHKCVWPNSGKHFLKTDNDISITVKEEAYQQFIKNDVSGLAISECTDPADGREFFMLHFRGDGYEVEGSIDVSFLV